MAHYDERRVFPIWRLVVFIGRMVIESVSRAAIAWKGVMLRVGEKAFVELLFLCIKDFYRKSRRVINLDKGLRLLRVSFQELDKVASAAHLTNDAAIARDRLPFFCFGIEEP